MPNFLHLVQFPKRDGGPTPRTYEIIELTDDTLASHGIRRGDEAVVAAGEFHPGYYHAMESEVPGQVCVARCVARPERLIGLVLLPPSTPAPGPPRPVPPLPRVEGESLTWMSDRFGNVTHVDPSAERLFGVSVESLLGYGFLDVVKETQRARVAAAWAESVSAGRVFEHTFHLRLADGSYGLITSIAVPVTDAQGAVSGYSAVSQFGKIFRVA